MTLHRATRSRGFSLIEILVAVVILATGLLALTALQGTLTKASAEAKVRGRVAAFVAGRMETLRNGPYAAIASGSDTCASTTAPDWVPASVCSDASLGSFSATQTVTTWAGNAGFVEGASPTDPDEAQFKRVTLIARWTDSTGRGHSLRSVSDISPLGFTANLIPPPEAEGIGGANPKVRQRLSSVVNPGMIPVALGDGSSSAASNPKPELKGSNQNQVITATKFNVLTYVPSGTTAVIQKRFENEIIKCSCKYGAAGTGFANLGEIYRTAQWPAIWTGDRYDVYAPDPSVPAPGQAKVSGQKSGVTQSALCMECCRDHHDTAASGSAKFDPERIAAGGGVSKYDASLVEVSDTISGDYVNACRVIRVDGFWRVAADTYSRQMGLLETETVSGAKAKTGLPTSTAKTAYETFVKDYLDAYTGTTGAAPSGAQGMFDDNSRGLNQPNQVIIATASNADYRYLHSRGLYVDYLEADARVAVADAIAGCSNLADCILPKLPFTTINVTELAKWTASVPSIITVNSGSLLTTNPSEPSGGRTIGKTNGVSDNTAEIRTSNSGLAVNTSFTFNGVDPSDNTTLQTDAQSFNVGGSVTTNPNGEFFTIVQTGGGLDPSAFFTISSDVNVECLGSKASKVCDPNASASAWAGSIKLSRYWEITYAEGSRSAITTGNGNSAVTTVDGVVCTKNDSNGPDGALTVNVPIFNNYRVNSVTVTGAGGNIITTLPAEADVSPGDNVQAESTTIAFAGLETGGTINVAYSLQGSTLSSDPNVTVAACTLTKSGSNWNLAVTSWNVPWD